MSASDEADGLLRWMTDQGRLAVDRWLRAESLEQDVLALLDELGELTPEIERRVWAVGRVDVGSYEDSPESFFTRDQIQRLYERNPIWGEIEQRVYAR
jgi:hypothetical protein